MPVPLNSVNEWLGIRKKTGNLMSMNLIVTSANAQTCARNLDNWTLKQQIAVVAVLMSAYAKQTCYRLNDLHKHIKGNHPFVRWMLNTEANADWVKDYAFMLLTEYGQRTGERHQGSKHIYNFIEDFGAPIGLEPEGFMNRAWDEVFDFRHEKDPFKAYRSYIAARWTLSRKKLSWGHRMPPCWYVEHQLAREGNNVFPRIH